MRKILTFTRYGITAMSAVARRAAITALGLSLAVTFCYTSNATAQTPAQALAPTATSGLQEASLVSWASSNSSSPNRSQSQAVDASYSLLGDTTQVQPAQYRGGAARPYPTGFGDACNAGCDVSWYTNFEALYLRPENEARFTLSRNTFLPDWDFEFAGRFTVGRLLDCVNGWEFSYAGPFDWQRSATVLGTASLTSNFQPSGGYTAANITAFNSADQHVQSWRAQLHNFEVNRRWWTWDVISTMIGVRFVDYEEDFVFLSSRTGVGTGVFIDRVDNQLIGGQVGADMLYPVSLRGNIGFRLKGGVYANFAENTTFLSNAGTVVLNAGDSSVDVAGLIEMGIFGNYQLVPSVRLTAGYEAWYMPGMATVAEQRPSLVNPSSGTTVLTDADLFVHGASAGVQILF